MSQDQYNWVYKELVQGPNDVVGALAYLLYKQQKIAFLEKIQADHNREPTPEELGSFHTYTRLEETLQGFKDRAEALADEFLEVALSTKLQQAETLIRHSVTTEEVRAAKESILSALDSTKQLLDVKLTGIATDSKSTADAVGQHLKPELKQVLTELTGKKTAMGWFRDVSANLFINIVTIVAVGMLITGYKGIGSLNNKVEEKSGVATATADKPDTTTASTPAAQAPEASKAQ